MTKKENFELLKEYVKDNAELTTFINHELELLKKKSTAPKKLTARQVENKTLKDVVLEELKKNGDYMTVENLQEANTVLNEITTFRIIPMLTALVNEGKATKAYGKKRKALYKVA